MIKFLERSYQINNYILQSQFSMQLISLTTSFSFKE